MNTTFSTSPSSTSLFVAITGSNLSLFSSSTLSPITTTSTYAVVKVMGNAQNGPEFLKFLANWTLPMLVFSLAVSLPSAGLYIAEIALILFRIVKKDPKFNTAFYKLFTARAINDTVQRLLTALIFRGSRYGLFKSVFGAMPSFVLGYFSFQTFVSLSAGNLATIFISLNRFTAVYIPLRHEGFWKRWLTRTILVVFLFPIPYNVHQIFYYRWFVHDHGKTYTIDNFNRLEKDELINATLAATIVSMLSMVASLALNVGTLVLYRRDQNHHQQRNPGASSNNSERRPESGAIGQEQAQMGRKLLVYAVATFAAHFISVLNLLLIYLMSEGLLVGRLMSKSTSDLLFLSMINFSSLVGDTCVIIVPAWLLIWASREVRRTVAKPFVSIFRTLKDLQQREEGTLAFAGIPLQQMQGANNQHREPE